MRLTEGTPHRALPNRQFELEPGASLKPAGLGFSLLGRQSTTGFSLGARSPRHLGCTPPRRPPSPYPPSRVTLFIKPQKNGGETGAS